MGIWDSQCQLLCLFCFCSDIDAYDVEIVLQRTEDVNISSSDIFAAEWSAWHYSDNIVLEQNHDYTSSIYSNVSRLNMSISSLLKIMICSCVSVFWGSQLGSVDQLVHSAGSYDKYYKQAHDCIYFLYGCAQKERTLRLYRITRLIGNISQMMGSLLAIDAESLLA